MSEELVNVLVEQLSALRSEVKLGFSALAERQDATNSRLDEANSRLSQQSEQLKDVVAKQNALAESLIEFRQQVTSKLEAFGRVWLDIDHRYVRFEERLKILEDLMHKFQRKKA